MSMNLRSFKNKIVKKPSKSNKAKGNNRNLLKNKAFIHPKIKFFEMETAY